MTILKIFLFLIIIGIIFVFIEPIKRILLYKILNGRIALKTYEILIFIIIVLFVFNFGKIINTSKNIIFKENLKKIATIELSNYIDLKNFKNDQPIFKIDSNLLIHAGNRLLCFDENGNNIWSREVHSEETSIANMKENTIIFDNLKGDFAIINKDNEVINNGKTNIEIEKVKTSNQNVYIKPKNKNEIVILNKNLKNIGKIKTKNATIINFIPEKITSNVYVYTTSIHSNKLKSYLYIYDENGVIIGSSDIDSSIVFDMIIDANINIICDNKIITFTKDAKLIADNNKVGNITITKAIGNRLYSIISNNGDKIKKSLKVFNENLEELASLPIPLKPKGMEVNKNKLIIYSDNKINIIKKPISSKSKSYTLNIENDDKKEKIIDIKWLSSKSFYVKKETKIIIYETN